MSLQGIVDHVLVVVGYLKEQIEAYMAEQTLFSQYTLVEQLPQPMGTGHAVQCCQPYLKSEDFLVINADDLYKQSSIEGTQPAEIWCVVEIGG